MTDAHREQSDSLSPESYAGYQSTAAPRWLVNRTEDNQAAFFLPHLRSGMDLLDCGCGPGSITLGLARIVAPGRTVGIDIDADQMEIAQSLVAEQNVSNVRFEAATVYRLPFADGSFDAIFSNAVLGHLDDPRAALQEMHRVLKPGGLLGTRNPDLGGQLLAPSHPQLQRYIQALAGIVEQKGDNPNVGAEQPALLHHAGFVQIQPTATYESYGVPEAVQSWAQVITQFLREDAFIEQFCHLGVEPSELDSMRQTWQAWSQDPTAFFADAWVETVGWKT